MADLLRSGAAHVSLVMAGAASHGVDRRQEALREQRPAHVGGMESRIDREGAHSVQKGLRHAAATLGRSAALFLGEPLLLEPPTVRRGLVHARRSP